jgi:drug/metabolite transporter (DMT)-like permease
MTKSQHPTIFGYGIILLSTGLFGSYGVWAKLMGPTFSPFYQTWVRSLLIIAIMLPFMIAGKSFRKIDRRDWLQVGVYIIFCVCTQVPLYYAYNHAPLGMVNLIFYSMFVIAAYAVGRFYLGETISKVKVVSMLLAFLGLVIIFGVSVLSFAPLGLLLAAFNGVASGGEVSSSKKVSERYQPALLAFWGWVFTFLLHLPLSLLIGEKQVIPSFDHAWLWLIVYSAVNAAAFWLVLIGYRRVDATIGSLIGLMEVVFAVLFGAIIFNQALTLGVYVGGLMVLVAAMLPDLINLLKGDHTPVPVEPVRDL